MKAFVLVISLLLLFSCSKKGIISMNVREPAEVCFRPSVKKIGVINRTLPANKTKILDDLEKLLTLEGLNLDKEGAQECISKLHQQLKSNDRFDNVVIIEDKELKTLGVGVLPNSLNSNVITNLCQKYNVDAILSLEFFDTDSKLNVVLANATLNTPLGNVPSVMHKATMQHL